MQSPSHPPFMYRKTVAVSAFILTISIGVSMFILATAFATTDLLLLPTMHGTAQRDGPTSNRGAILQPASPQPLHCQKEATRTT